MSTKEEILDQLLTWINQGASLMRRPGCEVHVDEHGALHNLHIEFPQGIPSTFPVAREPSGTTPTWIPCPRDQAEEYRWRVRTGSSPYSLQTPWRGWKEGAPVNPDPLAREYDYRKLKKEE